MLKSHLKDENANYDSLLACVGDEERRHEDMEFSSQEMIDMLSPYKTFPIKKSNLRVFPSENTSEQSLSETSPTIHEEKLHSEENDYFRSRMSEMMSYLETNMKQICADMQEKTRNAEQNNTTKIVLAHKAALANTDFTIETLKENIIDLNKKLQNRLKYSRKLLEFCHNRSNYIGRTWLNDFSLRNLFQLWHLNVVSSREERHGIYKAQKQYEKKMKRVCISRWLSYTRASTKLTLNLFWNEKLESTQRSVLEIYESKVKTLLLENKKYKHAVYEAEAKVRSIEGHLKQVFLSGVSAMNQSAMNLFSGMNEDRHHVTINNNNHNNIDGMTSIGGVAASPSPRPHPPPLPFEDTIFKHN